MGRTTSNTYSCDACRQTILPGPVVEMRTYGLAFHPACFTALTGPEIVRLMGEDETTVHAVDAAGARVGTMLRVRDPRRITPEGAVTGPREEVDW